jgi:hypothetical protein
MAVDWAPLVTPFLLPISFIMDLFQYWSIQWRWAPLPLAYRLFLKYLNYTIKM